MESLGSFPYSLNDAAAQMELCSCRAGLYYHLRSLLPKQSPALLLLLYAFILRCRAYELVCLAKGSSSADARAMLKYKDSPELYLDEFKASDQHFTSGLTHC